MVFIRLWAAICAYGLVRLAETARHFALAADRAAFAQGGQALRKLPPQGELEVSQRAPRKKGWGRTLEDASAWRRNDGDEDAKTQGVARSRWVAKAESVIDDVIPEDVSTDLAKDEEGSAAESSAPAVGDEADEVAAVSVEPRLPASPKFSSLPLFNRTRGHLQKLRSMAAPSSSSSSSSVGEDISDLTSTLQAMLESIKDEKARAEYLMQHRWGLIVQGAQEAGIDWLRVLKSKDEYTFFNWRTGAYTQSWPGAHWRDALRLDSYWKFRVAQDRVHAAKRYEQQILNALRRVDELRDKVPSEEPAASSSASTADSLDFGRSRTEPVPPSKPSSSRTAFGRSVILQESAKTHSRPRWADLLDVEISEEDPKATESIDSLLGEWGSGLNLGGSST